MRTTDAGAVGAMDMSASDEKENTKQMTTSKQRSRTTDFPDVERGNIHVQV